MKKSVLKKQGLNAFCLRGVKKIQKKSSDKIEVVKYDWSDLIKAQRNAKFEIKGKTKTVKLSIIKGDKFLLKKEPEEEIIYNDDYNYLKQPKIRVAISNYENKKAENTLVKKELALLDDDDVVYKLIGPVLIQQETSDAKIQVDSRIEMINKEIHKLEKNYQTNAKKIEDNRQKIADIQGKLIQLSRQLEQSKKEGK